MLTKRFDYIIIGQGLAGTCLAVQLQRKNRSVLVIDNKHRKSASKVAAGIFNPVTGRRITTTWKAEEIFDYLPAFYQSLEKELNERFFWELPIYRAFQNKTEQNDWVSKPENELPGYVKTIFTEPRYPGLISDPLGGIEFTKGGYLDTALFLNTLRKKFIEVGMLVEENFDLQEITLRSPFRIKNYEAKMLILCMGSGGCQDTPFGEEPFRPVKGELIEIDVGDNFPEVIFTGPVMITKQKNTIKAGATYNFKDSSWEVTDQGLSELKMKLESFLKIPFKITNQVAGIRPSSKDRRPVAGEHPEIEDLGILNGLGTKGVSLAPYISKLLAEYFENGKELDREIDIKRFFK